MKTDMMTALSRRLDKRRGGGAWMRLYLAHHPEQMRCFDEQWSRARGLDDFLDAVRLDGRLAYTSRAYAKIGLAERWRVPWRLDGQSFACYADCGCLLVSDASGRHGRRFDGFAKGWVDVHVMEGAGMFNRDMCDFRGSFRGPLRIHASDWDMDSPACETADGCWSLYTSGQDAFFERWGDPA